MDRERITISIKTEVLKMIDKAIDGVELRNRSHAIESLVLNALDNSAPVKAVVLLGGDNAIKSADRAIDFIKSLSGFGVKEVIVATGFLGDKVKDKIAKANISDVSIKYSDKGEGSGGAIHALKKELAGGLFIVYSNADQGEYNLAGLIEFHKTHNSTATLLTEDLSSMDGIYLFDPSVFTVFPKGYSMLEEDIVPKLAKTGDLLVCPIVR
ncbi:MAG: hypothetical protein WC227_02730 [Patescibacteria group bacterium]|jgi:hypothetical protein